MNNLRRVKRHNSAAPLTVIFQRAFRLFIILAALYLIGIRFANILEVRFPVFVILLVIITLARSVPVAISLEKPITFMASFVFTAAMLINGEIAGLCAIIACIVNSRSYHRAGKFYSLFLGAQYTLASIAAKRVFVMYTGENTIEPKIDSRDFIAICLGVVCFLIINIVLAGLDNLVTRYSKMNYTRSILRAQALAYSLSFPLSILIIMAYRSYHMLSLPILAIFLLVCAHAVRMSIENRNLTHQLFAINTLGGVCISSSKTDDPLIKFLEISGNLIAHESAIIWMWDESQTTLQARMHSPKSLPPPDSSMAAPGSLIYRIARKSRPVMISDISKELRQPGRHNPASWILCPITLHGTILGVAHFIRSASRPFTKTELGRITSLIPQVAIAYESVNIRLMMHRYQDMAITDGLTGLLNHRRAHEILRQEIKRAKRYQRPLSILMLDVDSFKSFNDTFGHPQGDVLLCSIAKILKRSVRNVDFVGRYGGEEFVVILPETIRSDAFILAERIREAIASEPFRAGGQIIYKTVSIGVASFPDDAEEPTELVQMADEALYRAKRAGKNCVLVA